MDRSASYLNRPTSAPDRVRTWLGARNSLLPPFFSECSRLLSRDLNCSRYKRKKPTVAAGTRDLSGQKSLGWQGSGEVRCR